MIIEGPMAEEHPAPSTGELTLQKIAVSSIGFQENDQIDHASDDCWFDDEPPVETSGAELIREQKWRHDHFYTMGYRDGISAGKEASAQEGFNVGFKQSAYDCR
ncbi:uncharacterized protein LOC122010213 isoform X1 [Zingiber officinale]|uniref:uncharacterized protein LOC122010213 isoform X1 n=2 Tax=Zingiber officinale TaxID=94328 RepID=UPI001C4B8F79|nr:uncharacterized protein LOC122010213 isoform X1 [Zingiber officinale]